MWLGEEKGGHLGEKLLHNIYYWACEGVSESGWVRACGSAQGCIRENDHARVEEYELAGVRTCVNAYG